jgi:ferritin
MSETECDRATREFIDKYIKEQVEEESQVLDIIKTIKMFGNDNSILYHIDKELAKR